MKDTKVVRDTPYHKTKKGRLDEPVGSNSSGLLLDRSSLPEFTFLRPPTLLKSFYIQFKMCALEPFYLFPSALQTALNYWYWEKLILTIVL